MDNLISAIQHHGYAILFAIVFLEVVGFPLPSAPALLISGALSAARDLQPGATIAAALAAILSGDTLMFLMGRYTGWWLLGILCRISLNPELCILKSADAFYKRGRTVLVFAKFVPGINTIGAPLAGSMNMRYPVFLAFDITGALLYTFAYWGAGFLFRDALRNITRGYAAVGTYFAWSLAVLALAWVAYRGWQWFRSRSEAPVDLISAPLVAARIGSTVIYDVRSHGYYDKDAVRIRGSARLDPNALSSEELNFPVGKDIVLYCT